MILSSELYHFFMQTMTWTISSLFQRTAASSVQLSITQLRHCLIVMPTLNWHSSFSQLTCLFSSRSVNDVIVWTVPPYVLTIMWLISTIVERTAFSSDHAINGIDIDSMQSSITMSMCVRPSLSQMIHLCYSYFINEIINQVPHHLYQKSFGRFHQCFSERRILR